MNNKLLISKILSLAYLSRQISDMDMTIANETISTAIDRIKLPEASFGVNTEKEALEGIIQLTKDIQSANSTMRYGSDKIMSELRLICGEDSRDLYLEIKDALPIDEMDQEEKRKSLLQDMASLTRYQREEDIRKTINLANIDITINKSTISDMGEFVNDIIAKLEELQLQVDDNDPAVINDIVFDKDRDKVEQVFERNLELEDDKITWKLNWKPVNVAFQGGWRPGDMVLLGAMQHNYKTSITLSLFRGLAIFNPAKNFLRDKTKKPMISRISFEDSMVNNLAFLALNILWNRSCDVEGAPVPDISTMTKAELSNLVLDELTCNGWHIHMSRVNGDEWGYQDIQRKVLNLEADGYEVHALVLDYLFMINTKGTLYDTTGSDIRSLLRKTKAFTSSKDILCITPSQLSPGVKAMISSGAVDKNDLLNAIKDLGMFSGSSKLPEEPDVVFYVNKVVVNGVTYLHFLVEKHRYIKTLDNEDLKSFYLKFPSNGMSIPDDIDGSRGIATYRLNTTHSNDFI